MAEFGALTPLAVERRLTHLEAIVVNRCERALQHSPWLRLLALFAAGVTWRLFMHAEDTSVLTPRDYTLTFLSPVIDLALLMAAARTWFAIDARAIIAITVLYLITLAGLQWAQPVALVALVSLGAWLAPLLFVWLQERGFMSRRALFFLSALVFLILPPLATIWGTDVGAKHFVNFLIWTERLIMPLSLLLLEVWADPSRSFFRPKTLALYLHPSALIYTLPLSHAHDTMEPIPLSATLSLFAKALLVHAFDQHAFAAITAAGVFTGTRSGLLVGFIEYLHVFMLSYASLNFGIVTARLLGLNLPDGTHFALLATDPVERWRRWNSYYYAWLFRCVYLPTIRWWRSEIVATQVTFLATHFLHFGRLTSLVVLPHHELNLEADVRKLFLFFQAHGLALLLTRWYPRRWRANHSLWGWLGVGLTYLIMALVHILRI